MIINYVAYFNFIIKAMSISSAYVEQNLLREEIYLID